jgi:hypothetical protein
VQPAPLAAAGAKRCNCRKSQCLKLYCECFSAGVLCSGCSCVSCHNVEEHATARDDAVKATLQRNPTAFKPKIKDAEVCCAPALCSLARALPLPGAHSDRAARGTPRQLIRHATHSHARASPRLPAPLLRAPPRS